VAIGDRQAFAPGLPGTPAIGGADDQRSLARAFERQYPVGLFGVDDAFLEKRRFARQVELLITSGEINIKVDSPSLSSKP